jgi:autotransporter-associated beta strand protein
VFSGRYTISTTFVGSVTGAGSLIKAGSGTMTLSGSNDYTGPTTVTAGTLAFASSLTTSSSLTVSAGATAKLTAGHNKALATNTISASGTGKLDITDNAVVVRASTPAAVMALIATGRNGGNWQGAGITSSSAAATATSATAVGYADNGPLNRSSFAGVNGLDANDVLVKYTYYGDSDLSGATTLDDFTLFLGGYQGGVAASWFRGDYDYSGQVTLDDFNLFLAGYRQQGAPLSAVEAMISAVPMSEAERAAMLAAVAAVPEPGVAAVWISAAAVVFLGIPARRRRHRPRISR